MLSRQIVRYFPSLVVPAIIAFAAIYIYTRVLTPEEYGYYALALSGMTAIGAMGYTWLQMSLMRLIPEAARSGKESALSIASYIILLFISMALVIAALIYAMSSDVSNFRIAMLLCVPLAITRAWLNINQVYHKAHMRIGRFNVLECGQALLGLAFGLLLVMHFGYGSQGAVLGMIIGLLLMALLDVRSLLALSWKDYDRATLMHIVRFGLPMVLTSATAAFLAVSDRFLIEHFRDAAELGVYAAGYTLMDRIITMLFMLIATPSFPLTVHKLEHEGVEAARQQTYYNGVAALFIAVPGCVGLIMTAPQLTELLIGAQFRAGALQVMPWIAVSAILGGMSIHYFDHAFYLAKKPHMLLFTQGPAALVNLLLNFILIPKYGFMGAAYANLASYILLITLSATVGRKVFAIKFPFKPAVQIAVASAVMGAVLYAIPFPLSFLGLGMMVALGGAVYGVMLLVLNVAGARGRVVKLLGKYR